MRLDGQTIIVTGASSGLGKAMAGAFVAEGAGVVCTARTEDRLERAVAGFSGPGDALALAGDVRNDDHVAQMVQTAEETFGPVTGLINSAVLYQLTAGGSVEAPLVDTPMDVWEAMLAVNVVGAVRCTKAVLPGMLDRGDGRIVFLSSNMGSSGRAQRAPYAASKFAIEGICGSLALELDGSGVAAFLLRPPGGGVATENLVEHGRPAASFSHEPSVIAEAAVQLVAGEAENGGRYAATPDGDGYESS